MNLDSLHAISPVDGRYISKTIPLQDYFSEAALIKYRLQVEVEYFIALCQLPLPQLRDVEHAVFDRLRSLCQNFSDNDALRVKEIEKITNHDVKAVEYFLKERFDEMGMGTYREFVHFGLTSQDINNTAVPLSIKNAWYDVLLPEFENLLTQLRLMAGNWKDIPMLARTHGQPASPTTLGKEVLVFVVRMERQLELLAKISFSGKFGGATGNFNAHHVAYPEINWVAFANQFLDEKLGIRRQQVTTQIENYDDMAAFFDGLKRLNTILIDLNRDFWTYISMDYFKQEIKPGEVGSSAMPHKVNPIDFENSEGNLGLANALLQHLSAKLPVSRLQRDLTDSTVSRNIGVPFAHTLIALQSLLKGLGKLVLNEEKIYIDLDDNWAVVAEAIQTILRRENYPNPYEALKNLTRKNQRILRDDICRFIDSLEIEDALKEELKKITPTNYTGIKPNEQF
ncbi:MAG TPA: adenylosuccinate lyase [Bacteroidales bacterium]|mgnify:CR=1 FL=1|nr:adenylosuccinate lyase [Bacteroidales bacterium]HRW96872.1 adenylosuccinate lyase [Bacteroidales bacterium]